MPVDCARYRGAINGVQGVMKSRPRAPLRSLFKPPL